MNVFDIIGPVMIGPSSSHTAGAVRLGRVVNKILDGKKPNSLQTNSQMQSEITSIRPGINRGFSFCH